MSALPLTGKIALEEHYALPETLTPAGPWTSQELEELSSRLLDIQDRRLREMDANGVERMILSLNSPAVQAVHDSRAAADLARRSNDYLAEQIARRPDRFSGFAALPMQEPDLAAAELTYAVNELGLMGALVNGFSETDTASGGLYYDLERYWPFWAQVEALNVPFYLHPRNPLPQDSAIYAGHPWLFGPAWAFGHETAVHALRLMGSGLFDSYPALQIILGHMGEGLPYALWRIDRHNSWTAEQNSYPARRRISEYFQENFYITTSGNFSTRTLLDAMMEIGSDRILFSVDWPYENVDHASNWFDTCPISEADRHKIGRVNSQKLFRLD